MKKPPKLLLGVDPGKTTGWALFENGLPVTWGQAKGVEAFDIELDDIVQAYGPPNIVIVEDFALFRGKALQQSGSKMEASQVIGVMASFARRHKAELVKQPSNILPIAQKWSKMNMPSNHSTSHWVSAYNHAWYYLVRNEMVLPVGIK